MNANNLTSTNYRETLQDLGFIVRYNQMTGEVEVNGEVLDDKIEASIQTQMHDYGCKNRALVRDVILVEAVDNAFHPIRERFEKLEPWDGTPRIALLSTYLKPKNPALAAVLLRKWMIAAVSKIFHETQNMILVIQGEQGTGKSCFAKWIASLFPARYFTADKLDPRNKDDQIKATRTAVWEIGELETTTGRADTGDLKRFITQDAFTVRRPYGRYDTRMPVTASFIGTVNPAGGFLKDSSGNRRFWILDSEGIDFGYRDDFAIEDIWAEAFAAFKAGEDFTLTADEAAANEAEQADVEILDPVAEAIRAYFYIDLNHPEWVTSCNTVRETLQLKAGISPAQIANNLLGTAAQRLGLKSKLTRIKRGEDPVKCYRGIRLKEQTFPPDRYDN